MIVTDSGFCLLVLRFMEYKQIIFYEYVTQELSKLFNSIISGIYRI